MSAISGEGRISATLSGPGGGGLDVISASIDYRSGTSPGNVSIAGLSSSRLKRMLEVDGTFVPASTNQGFTRTILPTPKSGVELRSIGWTLTFSNGVEIKPLILLEASIEKFSTAEGALGKLIPDLGEDRKEVWKLSLADPRIYWRETGYVAGRRNFRDDRSRFAVEAFFEGGQLTIDAPRLEYSEGEGGATIKANKIHVNVQIPQIRGNFDPSTLIHGNELYSIRELLEEIESRCPFIPPFSGGAIGHLSRVTALDLDYGEKGKSAAEALDLIAEAAGLVIGLQFDGTPFVDFDFVPTGTAKEAHARQLSWVSEARAATARPRSPKIRYYPSKYVKEIVLTDWEPVIKVPDDKDLPKAKAEEEGKPPTSSPLRAGSIVGIGEFSERVGIAPERIGEIAYAMAVKSDTERPGEFDRIERMLRDERGATKAEGEANRKDNALRTIADWAFRGYRFLPTPEKIERILSLAKDGIDARQTEFAQDALAASSFSQGGRSPGEARLKIRRPDLKALLPAIYTSPWNVVKKIEGVGDLSPRFYADLPRRRLYDPLAMAEYIVAASYVSVVSPVPSTFLVPATLAGLLKAKQYLEMGRMALDWTEGHSKALTFQARWMIALGGADGSGSKNTLDAMWGPRETRYPIEVFHTEISADVSAFAGSFDEKTGTIHFDRPLGIFPGSIATRKMMALSIPYLRATAAAEDANALPPTFPPPTRAATLFRLWADKLTAILKDDAANTRLILDRGGPFEPKSEFHDFQGLIREFDARSPGFPIAQLASLKTAIEQSAVANPTPGSPEGVIVPTTESVGEGPAIPPNQEVNPQDISIPTGGTSSGPVPAGASFSSITLIP